MILQKQLPALLVGTIIGLDPIDIDPDEDVADTPLIPTTSAGEIDPTADVPT